MTSSEQHHAHYTYKGKKTLSHNRANLLRAKVQTLFRYRKIENIFYVKLLAHLHNRKSRRTFVRFLCGIVSTIA